MGFFVNNQSGENVARSLPPGAEPDPRYRAMTDHQVISTSVYREQRWRRYSEAWFAMLAAPFRLEPPHDQGYFSGRFFLENSSRLSWGKGE